MPDSSVITLRTLSRPTPDGQAGLPGVALWCDDSAAGATWGRTLAAEGLRVGDVLGRAEAPSDSTALVMLVERSLTEHLGLLREWGQQHSDLPLMVVCRRLRDLDHVLALEMGADDVLDAALSAPVVAARLRALWRRTARPALSVAARPERITLGGLHIEWAARRAALNNQTVPLTEGEFEVLWLLGLSAGQVVTRDSLLRQVRGLPSAEADRSIDNRVYRIRHKLGPQAAQGLRTVRNRGYLLSPLGW